jgi:hypothetical protein
MTLHPDDGAVMTADPRSGAGRVFTPIDFPACQPLDETWVASFSGASGETAIARLVARILAQGAAVELTGPFVVRRDWCEGPSLEAWYNLRRTAFAVERNRACAGADKPHDARRAGGRGSPEPGR